MTVTLQYKVYCQSKDCSLPCSASLLPEDPWKHFLPLPVVPLGEESYKTVKLTDAGNPSQGVVCAWAAEHGGGSGPCLHTVPSHLPGSSWSAFHSHLKSCLCLLPEDERLFYFFGFLLFESLCIALANLEITV